MFSALYLVIFSLELCVLKWCCLCDSSLLIANANDKKSDVFSYLKKVQREFITRSHIISLNKRLSNISSHLC